MLMNLSQSIKFQWDKGNIDKNLVKHDVRNEEIEEAFMDVDKRIFRDVVHSKNEKRYTLVGKSLNLRKLIIVFTLRSNEIRAISAREPNRKEIKKYYEKTTNTTKI
jgi:uncharacterized DUF497 family protein